MPELPPHAPVDALEALVARRVRFVVIGGFASQLRGSPSLTGDTDVCYARDAENLERLALALSDLEASLRGAPRSVPLVPDAKTLQAGDHYTFDTTAGALDILGHPSGIPGGYEELERAADDMEIAPGLTVRVASIDDIIRMKRAAGRPKDLIEVEVLGALRDEIDAQAVAEHRRRRESR
ncbi:MAG TPA: hypothetical protein VE915_07325 [Actinomycetota bacterium]|jgi:hypothetical protein|nr:hypothetical protein [Actinomycetota bacterium]